MTAGRATQTTRPGNDGSLAPLGAMAATRQHATPNPLTWLIQRDVDRMLAAPARTSWQPALTLPALGSGEQRQEPATTKPEISESELRLLDGNR